MVPICEFVKIKTEEEQVTLSGTDLNISIEKQFQGDIDNGANEFMVHYKSLVEYLKLVTDIEIELTVGDKFSVGIKAGKSTASIEGEDPSNMPKIGFNGTTSISFSLDQLHVMKNKLFPFRGNDDLRPIMDCLLIEKKSENAVAYMASPHQSVMMDIDLGDVEDFKEVVHFRIVSAIDLFNDKDVLSLSFNSNEYCISSESCKFIGRNVDEKYPNIQQIFEGYVPDRFAEVDRKELLAELKKAKLFSSGEDDKAILTFSENELAIKAIDPGYNKAYENKIKVSYQDESLTIAVSATLFIKALSSFEEESVFIGHMGAEDKPLFVKTEGQLNLSMPMRL